MYVPIPVLLGATILFLIALVAALRRGRADTRRDLVAPSAPISMPADLQAEVRRLLAANRKIEAIRLVREATGLGLKQAKDFVEALEL